MKLTQAEAIKALAEGKKIIDRVGRELYLKPDGSLWYRYIGQRDEARSWAFSDIEEAEP